MICKAQLLLWFLFKYFLLHPFLFWFLNSSACGLCFKFGLIYCCILLVVVSLGEFKTKDMNVGPKSFISYEAQGSPSASVGVCFLIYKMTRLDKIVYILGSSLL